MEPELWLISNGEVGVEQPQTVIIVYNEEEIDLARQRLSTLLDIPYDSTFVNPVGKPSAIHMAK